MSSEHLPQTTNDESKLIPVGRIRTELQSSNTGWTFSTLKTSSDDMASVSRAIRIRRGPATDIGTLIGQKINVQHILIHPASTLKEDGEVEYYPRILLISEAGEVVATGAYSILDSINEFCQLAKRTLPLIPSVNFVLQQRPTTPPRRVYWLDPIAPEEPALELSDKKGKKKD